jgi:hypothetical protein
MKLWTYSELATKVERDLATEEELFVGEAELMGYFNEAVDQAEQEVLGLYEDYFLTRTTLALVSGTEEYSLPSDIYAEKIRRVVFNNGSEVYPVDRIRDWKKFEIYADVNLYGSSDRYRYMLYNPSAGQSKLLLVPPARETGSYVTIWHIRNANVFTGDSDILDIPESANFIMRYVKNCVMAKETYPNPIPESATAALEAERDLLKSSLANMVPDADNLIEADTTYYEEMT